MRKALIASFFPTLAIIAGFVFVSFTSRHSQSESDNVPVGTVIYSLIPPTQFMKLNEGWALLDGSQMSADWQLSKTINVTGILQNLGGKLPDASGMFFRAMNYNNKGADPSERLVGSKQWDAFEKHTHKISIKKNTEPKDDNNFYYLGPNYPGGLVTKTYLHNMININVPNELKFAANEPSDIISSIPIHEYDLDEIRKAKDVMSLPSEHIHNFKYDGSTSLPFRGENEQYNVTSTETRPVNIALYVYIKVN